MYNYRVNQNLTGTIATVPTFRTLELAMRNRYFRHFLIGVVAVAAALQWSVVLERTWAAVWAWYKFAGYGGGGHLVVDCSILVVLLLGSCGLSGIAFSLSSRE